MDLKESISHQSDVALTLTKHLFSKEVYQHENLVFSPLSLHVVLSIMAAGSEGSTLDELLSFLRFDSTDRLNSFTSQLVSDVLYVNDAPPPSPRLSFASRMWADKTLFLSPSFIQLMATHYKTSLASLDFKKQGRKVCRVVNSWVEKETDGLITELLDPESVSNSSSRLIIANALCIKGVWKHKFDASMTYNRVFYLLNGTSIRVPFMSSMKAEQFVSVFDDLKVLRLSYKQGRDKKRQFSMYIFLPEAEDGLPALIEKVASEPGFLEDKLPKRKVKVRVFMIPKFKISFMLEASNVLKELGVVLPFSRCDANFTNMVDSPSDELYIDNMFHKAFIEVNEEGTEAAAASSGRLVRMCDSDSVSTGPDFVADHPFLFLIKEDLSGTILFIGRVLHPDEVDTLEDEDEDEDEDDTLDEDEDDTVEDEDDDIIY